MDAQTRRRYTLVAAIAGGVISALIFREAFRQRSEASSGTPARAAPPLAGPEHESKYPECRRLAAFYRRMQQKRDCTWDGFAFGYGICETVYQDRKDCIDEYENVARCMTAQPEASWRCDATTSVALKDDKVCAGQIRSLYACSDRK